MLWSRRENCRPYVTRDGSLIRELMHPDTHGNEKQSLAEAIVPVGQQTIPHLHRCTEELYYVHQGSGVIQVGDELRDLSQGDTVAIPPGTVHCIRNSGDQELVILCCCTPPYSHDDTVLQPES